MKPLLAVIVVACLVEVGCDEDPARKVRIETPPAASAPVPASQTANASGKISPPRLSSSAGLPHTTDSSPAPARVAPAPAHMVKAAAHQRAAANAPLFPWLQDFCPLPTEASAGASSFAVQGPCEFQHQGLASCQAIGDDFLVAITRKARQGTMVTFINVEHYTGPGSYEGSQIFIALQNGTTIHRWSSDTVNTVVGPGESFLDISKTPLELEPTLQDCSKLIGPETGYQFQCGGRDIANPAGDKGDEVVSGKLQCAARN
jgi:hypothetical protein